MLIFRVFLKKEQMISAKKFKRETYIIGRESQLLKDGGSTIEITPEYTLVYTRWASFRTKYCSACLCACVFYLGLAERNWYSMREYSATPASGRVPL